jgi:RNA polymerase primary sigma factor
MMSHDEDAFERRAKLKKLIVLGKERGWVTDAEINEHLPDGLQNTEQIDGIIDMINDMGIEVRQETAIIYDFKKPIK